MRCQSARGLDAGPSRSVHLALAIPTLAGGGVARAVLHLATGLAERGYRVDLVLCRLDGPYRRDIPASVNTVELDSGPAWRGRVGALLADYRGLAVLALPVLFPVNAGRPLAYLDSLVDYLQREQPAALFSAKTHMNLLALWARRLAGVSTRVVVSERTHLSRHIAGAKRNRWRWRFIAPVVARTYPWADDIVCVSEGVADDLAVFAHLDRSRLKTIYNPVVTPDLADKARAPIDHPWFRAGAPPVVLGVGRITSAKDFPTLLRAFARVRSQRNARLMILGGSRQPELASDLTQLARDLGVGDDVSLPGFADNPYAFMARAAVFVLSSAWEGLPNVLIQAMACGCPVVSTDCHSGPSEILAGGAFGRLVPVGDDAALAQAILETFDAPPARQRLLQRAAMFSRDRAVERHLEVLLDRPAP